MSMGSVLYTMITAGVSFSVFSDFMSLQNTAHMAAVHRYSSNGEGGSLVGQILGSFIYISPICCGYSYIFAKEKKAVITTLCILGYIMILLPSSIIPWQSLLRVRPWPCWPDPRNREQKIRVYA